jgi:hypothetical protein
VVGGNENITGGEGSWNVVVGGERNQVKGSRDVLLGGLSQNPFGESSKGEVK